MAKPILSKSSGFFFTALLCDRDNMSLGIASLLETFETRLDAAAGEHADVLLITMPWSTIQFPSIQLGYVQAHLAKRGISVRSAYYNLAFTEFLLTTLPEAGQEFHWHTYDSISGSLQPKTDFAEWCFAVPPFRTPHPETDSAFIAHLRGHGVPTRVIDLAFAIREVVPHFLDRCVSDVIGTAPRASSQSLVGKRPPSGRLTPRILGGPPR